MLVVATKSQDSVAVLSQWARRPVAGGGTAAERLPVVCAQNGVANERFALRRFRHVYGMCVWLPAAHVAPGEVAAYGQPLAGLLWVGRYPSGTDETVQQVAADLAGSRLLAPVSPEVMRWKYRKLLSNLGNAIEALCGRPGAGLDGDPSAAARELSERATAEGTAVLDEAGIGYATPAEVREARLGQVDFGTVSGVPRGGGSSWQSLDPGHRVDRGRLPERRDRPARPRARHRDPGQRGTAAAGQPGRRRAPPARLAVPRADPGRGERVTVDSTAAHSERKRVPRPPAPPQKGPGSLNVGVCLPSPRTSALRCCARRAVSCRRRPSGRRGGRC